MFTFSRKEGARNREWSGLTDVDLLKLYKTGSDHKIIGELFKRYTHLVFGLCMKYLKNEDDSKDAVMQIFEKLFTDLHRHEISNFKSWLYSVSKNHCLMALRKTKVEVSSDDHVINNYEGEIMENEVSMHQDFIDHHPDELNAALNSLKAEQKECIRLFYLEEKSYKEVAELTGYSLVKVKSYIQNGKRNLKIRLSKTDE
ncbi:MAG: sigma-70 family RNA polymerase sigma factor [Bacteroidetes bacterium]|nr:sigma-70 family RNA polymerase sigma factor [Bacteroidota bacterium]